MSWTVLCGLALALGIALFAALARRAELARMARRVREREQAVRHGTAEARLRHPVVDLSRCLGCGTCVAACPENGVLELVHGQAVVVNGARCVGHAACERECPVGAITVTLTNLERRRDVPVLTEQLEAVGSPGVFLAGEVTAHALIKPAIEQGAAVAAEVARRVESGGADRFGRDPSGPDASGEPLDVCIVGAGPAGLACALEAKRRGLRFVVVDQEPDLGGAVAKYPRRKLVLTQPVELPLHGRLDRAAYTKEELIELWRRVAREHGLPLRSGEAFQGLDKRGERYVVRTDRGEHVARHVCLALGRRGTPNKLGVEGEELPKVAYGLLDARSYSGRRILVVGGGDSAIEAAMGLAGQPGNEVTVSYRRASFFRVRARNEARLEQCIASGRLRILFESEVVAIRPREVELRLRNGAGEQSIVLPNDDVFVMAGGVTPIALLERSGVSFDPALRAAAPVVVEQGTGLAKALGAAFAVAAIALAWALWHADYYLLPAEARPADPKHALLRPGRGLGLAFGVAAAALVAINLLYLVRRWPRLPEGVARRIGSLRAWMTSHVATGILALALATLHAAMSPRDSVGGHALTALAVLAITGAIGRYFYAWVPRAANGRELEVAEVKLRLVRLAEEWDRGQRGFVDRVQAEIASLIDARQWKSSLLGRVAGVIGARRKLRRRLAGLADVGRSEGIAPERIEETLHLARRAHAQAIAAAHLEDLRALLGSWRYLHRWIALLLVLLVAVHVAYALIYGSFGSNP